MQTTVALREILWLKAKLASRTSKTTESFIGQFVLAVVLFTSSGQQTAWAQRVIHVAPQANSKISLADFAKNPDAPVTLAQALNILTDPSLRDIKGTLKEPITIRLGAGTYRLDETLQLDASSSGSAEHPVLIEGPKDAVAIISGGRVVNGFTPVTDPDVLARIPESARLHVMQADLPGQGISYYGKQTRHGYGAINIPTALDVYFRSQPMTLARWPNRGFIKIATIPEGETGLAFTVQGANLRSWKDEPDLLATGYWSQNWADATIRVKSMDVAAGRIVLTAPPPPFGIKAGQPVFFQNALSELDQPGEWYLNNAKGLLYFWPPQAMRANDLEISMLDKLLVADNASYINISGLTFENARADAVTVKDGHHVTITDSVIRNIGNRGAVIGGHDNGIVNTAIENIGEGGVVLAGGDRQTLTAGNLYVERSTIRNFGRVSRTYQPAILMSGVGNRAVGNHISDAPHTAILFTGNDHLISRNDISDVCKETGDAGVIYTGRDWTARGTVIADNYIHDIPPNVALGRTKGVYLDDQASGITVRRNRFARVEEAVFIGGGRDNLVEDNIFIDTTTAIHLDARGITSQRTAVDDPNSTWQKHLAEVPYNNEKYSGRYSNLATLLNDDPGAPKYNIARHNRVVGKAAISVGKDAESGISMEPLIVLPSNEVNQSGMPTK